MISHVDPQFSMGGPWGYALVVKSMHILRTQISADEKWLEHYHVLNIAEKCYEMQLVAIKLDQQHVRLHDPQQLIIKLQLCSKGFAINLILLMRDSAKPFWVRTYGTQCCT
jgi:hypothetical protein